MNTYTVLALSNDLPHPVLFQTDDLAVAMMVYSTFEDQFTEENESIYLYKYTRETDLLTILKSA